MRGGAGGRERRPKGDPRSRGTAPLNRCLSGYVSRVPSVSEFRLPWLIFSIPIVRFLLYHSPDCHLRPCKRWCAAPAAPRAREPAATVSQEVAHVGTPTVDLCGAPTARCGSAHLLQILHVPGSHHGAGSLHGAEGDGRHGNQTAYSGDLAARAGMHLLQRKLHPQLAPYRPEI